MAIQCPKCDTENPSDSKYCKECATPLSPTENLQPSFTKTLKTPVDEIKRGSVLAGRYEIVAELGKGGMGKVYRAVDLEVKEEVALKLIKPEVAQDEATIERFRNELKVARKVSHRNVCRMHDLGKTEEGYYISMEFVEGQDLKNYIRKNGKLTEAETISLGLQVGEGLKEAHEFGVIHRDMKPQNIMIDRNGSVKIMDFGIARSVEAEGVTQTGIMIGTPDYISPEQVEGAVVDHRTDIYSVGVILFEMVTGTVPFKGDTALSVAFKHKAQLPREPKKINPEISDDLNRLILICMEKDRGRRYQSAQELLSDLRNIGEGLPLGSKIQPRRAILTAIFLRKKLLIPALIAALLIIALITWQVLSQKEATPISSGKPSVAIMYFKNNTGDKNFDFWKTALADSLITDLSQSKLLKVLSGDKLYQILKDLNQLEATIYSADVLREVATRGEVTHIVQGSFAKAGNSFRLDITIQESNTGDIIGSERVEGKGEESLFAMVDELTREIKVDFRLTPQELRNDIDKEAASITTRSPEAYKYYIEAKEYFQERSYRQSLAFFEKAVDVDPEFAMAYRDMAFAHQSLGDAIEMKVCFKKALALTDRISDKERYIIQTTYYLVSERDYPKAIEACERLLELYPDDLWGNSKLGAMYADIEEWEKAVDQYRILVQTDPESVDGYTSLASAYMALGLHHKVQEVLDYYLKNYPDNEFIHYDLAKNYIHQEKYELALVELEKSISLNPNRWSPRLVKGDIFLFMGDFVEAEKEYQQFQKSEQFVENVYSRDRLANLYLLQGKSEKSKEYLTRGIELAKLSDTWASGFYAQLAYQNLKSGNIDGALEASDMGCEAALNGRNRFALRSALYVKCLANLKMNMTDEAQKITDELKLIIEKGATRKAIRFYYLFRGLIEIEDEDYSEAIQYLNKALPLLPGQHQISEVFNDHAIFMEPLGLAYFKSGKLEEAKEEFLSITRLTYGRLYYGDIYAKSFYMLGKICEQQGDTDKAIEHYEKFLDLWKDADPGIAEVEDARERLAGFKSQ